MTTLEEDRPVIIPPPKSGVAQLEVLVEIIYRRKWTIILPVLLCTGIAVVVASALPPYYRSTTLIIVEPQQISQSYVTPTDSTPIEARLNTLRQQIMSRTKLEQIIKELEPYNANTAGQSKNAVVKAVEMGKDMLKRTLITIGLKEEGGNSETGLTIEGMVERMRKDIEVKVLGGTRGGKKGGSAFTINYIGQNPYTTMQVTTAIASLYIEENLKVREQHTVGTSEFIISELEKAQKDLEEQETMLRTFKEKYMGALPGQLEANLRALDRFQLELQSVEMSFKISEERLILLTERLRNIKEALSTGSVVPLPGNAPNTRQQELARLKSELSSLLSIYKEGYPDVIMTRNRIKELEEQLAGSKESETQKEEAAATPSPLPETNEMRLIREQSAAARIQLKTLKRRRAAIRRQIKIFEKRVEDTPKNEQRFAAVIRDHDISQQNYQSLLGKKLNARLAENLEKRQKGERFRVVDPANLPEKPFKPNKPKIIFLGIGIGILIGGGLVYLLDFMNPAFRRADDFRGVLPYPVLATIPTFQETKTAAARKGKG